MDSIALPKVALATARLALAPIRPSDREALSTLWRDPEVRRYLWDNQIVTELQVSAIQRGSDACFENYGAGLYTITLRDAPDKLAGFCGFREFESPEQLELLYGIYPDYWGQGLVSEAVSAVLRQGFEECALSEVIAATDTPNQRSVRVMQRLGMGFAERRLWHGLDTVFYTMTKEDYFSLNK